jgi:hypothetical protein
MPHFQANKLVILKQEDLKPGYTLESVYEAMKDQQFPIRFKKGAVSYEIGMLIRAYLGRDAIVADIGLDPEFELIVDKLYEKSEIEGEPDKEHVIVKHLEWVS